MPKNADVVERNPTGSRTLRLGSAPADGSTSLTSRPSLPPLPAPLASAIDGGRVSIFGRGGFEGYQANRDWQPPTLYDDHHAALVAALNAYRAALEALEAQAGAPRAFAVEA